MKIKFGSDYKRALILSALFITAIGIIQLRPAYKSVFLEIPIFVISLYILLNSADLFTSSAVKLGNRLGLSKLGTGVLIIAIGTSAPEFFSSMAGVIEGHPDIVIGNIFGTVIANTLLGIGFAAVIAKSPLKVHKDVIGTQMAVFLGSIVLGGACLYDGVLSYYEGVFLLIVLGFYLKYVINSSQQTDTEKQQTEKTKENTAALLIFLIINLCFLFLSGDFAVSSLIEGSKYLGISDIKVAASLLAVGTSVPEIATAVALVRQNNADSLFGEILGSNIFDILGVLGALSLFSPLTMPADLLLFLCVSMFSVFALIIVVMNDRSVNRLEGIILLSLFVLFTIQLAGV